jgi:bifunctional DNA-binding transcriptional regulator/antitoxin component of YhaV-PrlF toxin-antitoxin module
MSTTLTVDDDGVLTFPPYFLEEMGWKEGDVLQWIDNQDGSWSLTKPDTYQSMSKQNE